MKRQSTARNNRNQKTAATRRKFPVGVVAVLILGVVIGLGFWSSRSKPLTTSTDKPAAESNLLSGSAATVPSQTGFQQLVGRWRRPDGGYILEILSASSDGKLEASYLNPKPIHVARAAALQDSSATKVFVELRDVNYPGSTYTLSYDPASDQLKGMYFQAALRQEFDVVFERLK